MNFQALIDAFSKVNYTHPDFIISACSIIFNPLFWNIVARNEYRNKTLTKIFKSPKKGCYFLAFVIFTLGIVRDLLFAKAIQSDSECKLFDTQKVKILGYISLGIGSVLVYSSMYVLGIIGTYLGDYFGILMEKRVTGFPFNVCDNPMYTGSTLNFLGTALLGKSCAGVVLTILVWIVYVIALKFEGPFTSMIYANKNKKTEAKKPAANKQKSKKNN
ncbi:phospholipid methyltransferase [Neocallimastix lanati (nom. inval.)]|jgi:methylene-fatty-acyl-phospholipid synthase|uniref:Phosphatidyl-N-methylethanolamine N-methyltransferase n=1 Tax=Neocallimastix californiae TaxID=1754190 RepID=A0A1Y2F9P6_9FUNG|nr:phospholipid methyltransferase [Neocallimastix sp. JGI-2020a]ORY80652.1 phospholipid methyltransferase [Neocallimastix californiae]|eukprot:ORY80652.1 phospholipid methyltransferase [Neocallimastix californiae]